MNELGVMDVLQPKVQASLPLILERLGVKSQDEVTFVQDGTTELSHIVWKLLGVEPDKRSNPSKLQLKLLDALESGWITDDPNRRWLSLGYAARSFDDLVCVLKFKGLECSIGVLRYQVRASDDYCVIRTILVVRRSELNAVIQYFDDLKASVKQLYASVMGGGSKLILPLAWDKLTLDSRVKLLVKNDLERFYQSKNWYEERNLAYQRGYLFYGEPGNGKSSALRAMLTQCESPKVYVMGNMNKDESEKQFVDMFESAKETKNAFILMEDVDRYYGTGADKEPCKVSLSTFLNCMDGIGGGDGGLVVIATANHPKNLDAAILKRPGRFDRVVEFPVPDEALCIEFFKKMDAGLDAIHLQIIADKFIGMSYAQLREVYILASQISWDETRAIDANLLVECATELRRMGAASKEKSTAGFVSLVKEKSTIGISTTVQKSAPQSK
jgi:hypothetical protein